MTRRLIIQSHNRKHEMAVVRPEDFTTIDGEEVDPQEILSDPAYTLYCFDPENKRVLFTQTQDPLTLDQAPFYYIAQAENPVSLVAMDEETFHQIAETIPDPKHGYIFVHSVGRCGSTLLSKVLAGIPQVHSLSEPDDLTQLNILRIAKTVSDEWLTRAISSSIRWRAKPGLRPYDFVAIKTRSEVSAMADILAQLPHTKFFFLYRDGLSWLKTVFRTYKEEYGALDDEAECRHMEAGWGWEVALIGEHVRPEKALSKVQIRTLCWVSAMETYFDFLELGVPLAAARFEDLTAHPREILKQFFVFCGIEDVDWEAIEEILGKDSQAGSRYAQEKRYASNFVLPEEFLQQMRDLVAERPLLGDPGVVLPGTFGV